MHEAMQNLGMEDGIVGEEGQSLAKQVLEFMRENIVAHQVRTGNLYNLEATPAESTCYRLALKSLAVAPNIIVSGDADPYFTNSSMLPVGHTDDIFLALKHQDPLQVCYTGGTVLHGFLGERLHDWRAARDLVRNTFTMFRLPYLSITPTFSVCAEHGYLAGEQPVCPYCNAGTEVWSRVTGFYRAKQNYNPGKAEEYKDRKEYIWSGVTTDASVAIDVSAA